jgi:6-phosphogluconate dehydrogenase
MQNKEIGVIGLGKMGRNIALQMLGKGYKPIVWNRSNAPVDEAVRSGAVAAATVPDLVKRLKAPRVVWLMLPAGEVTNSMVKELSHLLEKGDTIIDGSNSEYRFAVEQHAALAAAGIRFIDAGCSGGPSGALNGMSIMVGGDPDAFRDLEELFRNLSVEGGCAYMGGPGSGHFVKMVHNAIEYGEMQAIAEGMDLVANGPYKDLDLQKVAAVWNHGSVIRGYLMELTERALSKDRRLGSIEPYVEDNGEGRWSVQCAVDHGIPFTVISHALFERFSSRSGERFGDRLLAALRHEFGGHSIKGSR